MDKTSQSTSSSLSKIFEPVIKATKKIKKVSRTKDLDPDEIRKSHNPDIGRVFVNEINLHF